MQNRRLLQISPIFIIVPLLLLGIGILLFTKANKAPAVHYAPTPTSVIIGDTIIPVEAVTTPEDQQKGLGYRDSLDQDRGMLFVFPDKAERAFWMMGMRFPIDILYIEGNTISRIYENVPHPQSDTTELPIYPSQGPADRVLEVNAGFAQSHGIKTGDKIIVNL